MSYLGAQLDEWLDALSLTYAGGVLPETTRSVAKLMEGDGGLLIAVTTFRAVDLLHEPRPYGSALKRLTGRIGKDPLAHIAGPVCLRCREAYPCATIRMISKMLRLPVSGSADAVPAPAAPEPRFRTVYRCDSCDWFTVDYAKIGEHEDHNLDHLVTGFTEDTANL